MSGDYSTVEVTWGGGVAYGNGIYVVTKSVLMRDVGILTSNDGKSWTDHRPVFWNSGAVHFVNGSFLVSQAAAPDWTVVPPPTGRLLTSADGAVWVSHPQPFLFDLLGAAFGRGLYIGAATMYPTGGGGI